VAPSTRKEGCTSKKRRSKKRTAARRRKTQTKTSKGDLWQSEKRGGYRSPKPARGQSKERAENL
jgi:hypothetical protein